MKKHMNLIAVLAITATAGLGIAAPAFAKTADERIDDACRYYDKEYPGYYERCVKQYRGYFGSDYEPAE